MRSLKRGKGLVWTAGALAAGVAACDNQGCSQVCDPLPPPLCDRLDRDAPLRITTDRDTIPLGGTATFTGTVTDTVVSEIEAVNLSAEVGTPTEAVLHLPRSFSFTWGPRNEAGGFTPGQHQIRVYPQVMGTYQGRTNTCEMLGEIVVSIDAQGTAVIVSLPEPNQALGVYFDVHVAAGADGDAVLLKAIPTLTPEESQRLIYRWRASAGAIEPTGDQARFVPPLDGDSAVVQVEAVLDGSSLAVGVWEWRGR